MTPAARLKRDKTIPGEVRLWAAVIHQAEKDARDGDGEAAAWLTEMRERARINLYGGVEMERRAYKVSNIRAESPKGKSGTMQLVGYAAVFDSLSAELWGFREKIRRGAFADRLTGDIRALWNHDTNLVMGRTTNGSLRLFEDDHGLRVEITPANTVAMDDLITLVARGDVSQMSFGFTIPPGGDDWEETASGEIIRTLLEIRLLEVSPVTFPAYPSTEIGVRSAELGKRVVPPKRFRTAARAAYRARERQLQLLEAEIF